MHSIKALVIKEEQYTNLKTVDRIVIVSEK